MTTTPIKAEAERYVETLSVPVSPPSGDSDGLNFHNAAKRASQQIDKGKEFVFTQYVKVKEQTQKSPWLVSVVIIVSCFGVIWSGLFDSVGKILTLAPAVAMLKAYQVLFALLVLIVELTRYFNVFDLRGVIRAWFRVLETTLGRGLLQCLAGSIAIAHFTSMGELVPGSILVLTGGLNAFYGMYT
eukprot:Lankesteria_metandrocarpae@DN6474_c0_g1_i1.p1